MAEQRVSKVLTQYGELLRHDMTMFLQRKAFSQDMKLPIKVVGWVGGKFFLTMCPCENGMKLELESGNALCV
jgi:hypothetical protein